MKYISLSIFLVLSLIAQNDANAIILTHRLRHKHRYQLMEDEVDEEETKESPVPKKQDEESEQADPEVTDDNL